MKVFIYGALGIMSYCYPASTYYVSITSGNPTLCNAASDTRANGIECLYDYGAGMQQYISPHVTPNFTSMGSIMG